MKTLLMISLMLLSLCQAKGQLQDSMKHSINSINEAWMRLAPIDITFSVVPFTPNITLQDLLDYQKECYNDSTLVKTAVMKRSKYQSSPGDNNMEIDYIQIPYPYKYKHYHKPTFEGFIEYMKRKYKVK